VGSGVIGHGFEGWGGELGDEVFDFGGGEGVVYFEGGHVQALLGHCPEGFGGIDG
jgi:hypothetical protein